MIDHDRLSRYNTEQKSDHVKKEKFKLGDYKFIQYQILSMNIIRIVWETVRRITKEIWGWKG